VAHSNTIVPHDQRPAIQPRLFSLPKPTALPRFWMDNDPYGTYFLDALSCIFPGGERFFVKSVLDFQNQVTDLRLKREARAFCGQEAVHGQQHEAFNEWSADFGLGLAEMTRKEEAHMLRALSKLPKIKRLAVTAALEHMTAIMGNALLNSPTVMEKMHPDVRALWVWHSIEEIEHKAVAHEVYYAVGGTHWGRYIAMFFAFNGLMSRAFLLTAILAWREGQLFNFRSMKRFMGTLVGSGYAGRVWKGLMEYFSADFHPWQIDDRTLLAEFLPQVMGYVPVRSQPAVDTAV